MMTAESVVSKRRVSELLCNMALFFLFRLFLSHIIILLVLTSKIWQGYLLADHEEKIKER